MIENSKFTRKTCKVCRGRGEREYQNIDSDGGIIESGIRICSACDGEGHLFFNNHGIAYTFKEMLKYINVRHLEHNPSINKEYIGEWLRNDMSRTDHGEVLINAIREVGISVRNDKVTLTMELT